MNRRVEQRQKRTVRNNEKIKCDLEARRVKMKRMFILSNTRRHTTSVIIFPQVRFTRDQRLYISRNSWLDIVNPIEQYLRRHKFYVLEITLCPHTLPRGLFGLTSILKNNAQTGCVPKISIYTFDIFVFAILHCLFVISKFLFITEPLFLVYLFSLFLKTFIEIHLEI